MSNKSEKISIRLSQKELECLEKIDPNYNFDKSKIMRASIRFAVEKLDDFKSFLEKTPDRTLDIKNTNFKIVEFWEQLLNDEGFLSIDVSFSSPQLELNINLKQGDFILIKANDSVIEIYENDNLILSFDMQKVDNVYIKDKKNQLVKNKLEKTYIQIPENKSLHVDLLAVNELNIDEAINKVAKEKDSIYKAHQLYHQIYETPKWRGTTLEETFECPNCKNEVLDILSPTGSVNTKLNTKIKDTFGWDYYEISICEDCVNNNKAWRKDPIKFFTDKIDTKDPAD